MPNCQAAYFPFMNCFATPATILKHVHQHFSTRRGIRLLTLLLLFSHCLLSPKAQSRLRTLTHIEIAKDDLRLTLPYALFDSISRSTYRVYIQLAAYRFYHPEHYLRSDRNRHSLKWPWTHRLKHNGRRCKLTQKQPILRFLLTIILVRGASDAHKTRRREFLGYHLFTASNSLQNFLRCSGPRRIEAFRHIEVDDSEYQVVALGRGGFSTISRVEHKPSGNLRVTKRITFDKDGLAEMLAQAEVDALKAMHDNLWFPDLLNDYKDNDEFVITIPFYGRGDLASLVEHKGYLGRELAQFYCAELILAIQCLHKANIVHRDIKPENILLDDTGHLVLADLGLSVNIGGFEGDESEMARFSVWLDAKAKGGDEYPLLWVDGLNPLGMRGGAGTYWYTAPEVFRNERYSFGVDYWSVGVLYYELITGHIPFDDFRSYPENKRPVLDFQWKTGQLKGIEDWERDEISKFLAPLPRQRPQTVSDIKNGRIFASVNWDQMSRREICPPILPPPLLEHQ